MYLGPCEQNEFSAPSLITSRGFAVCLRMSRDRGQGGRLQQVSSNVNEITEEQKKCQGGRLMRCRIYCQNFTGEKKTSVASTLLFS